MDAFMTWLYYYTSGYFDSFGNAVKSVFAFLFGPLMGYFDLLDRFKSGFNFLGWLLCIVTTVLAFLEHLLVMLVPTALLLAIPCLLIALLVTRRRNKALRAALAQYQQKEAAAGSTPEETEPAPEEAPVDAPRA